MDSDKTVADLSQQTSQVELAAPGVAVRSTVTMGTGTEESLEVDGSGYEATGMEGSAQTTATGALFRCNANGGLGAPGDCEGASGKICLISRGDLTFAEKALECEDADGLGVVIFNNTTALFSGTFGDSTVSIPGVGISGTDGTTLMGELGKSATINYTEGDYAYYDGTSMATPHVAGVAALVWSQDLNCTNADIRSVLASSALDLGPDGRDNAYGHGLVQAGEAVLGLDCDGGDVGGQCDTLLPKGESCSSNSQCCSGSCKGRPGRQTCK